jgi:probable rRNA maturation factor
MGESESEAGEPVVEIAINTGSEQDDKAAARLLETLNVEEAIKRTLQAVRVTQSVMLTLVICGDVEMQALNRQYRQQDKPTDVLSFPLLDEPLVEAPPEWLWQSPESPESVAGASEETKPVFVTPEELGTNLGDIVISWPTVRRQAREVGHDVAYELLFLLCHGVLHLVGYDDATEAGYTEMVRLQKEVCFNLERDRKEFA